MNWIDIITLATAMGAATIGGTFFAFSNFVMPALARLPAPGGIAAMQSVDVTVMNPKFLGIFTGTAVLGAVLVILVFFGGSLWSAAGAVVYIVGTFIVTMAINVPMNNRLNGFAPESSDGAAYWQTYLRDWVSWNTIRAAAALLATVLLILALAL